GEEWIFAVGLLATTPARIAKDIDIWRPEVEAFHDVAASGSHRLVMLGPSLGADYNRHFVDRGNVESSRQANRLRKHGGDTGASRKKIACRAEREYGR